MKKNKFNYVLVFQVIFLLASISSCNSIKDNKNPKQQTETAFVSPLSTILNSTKTIETSGDLEVVRGDNIPWKGNGALTWEVEIAEKDDYEFYLVANVRLEGSGSKVYLKTQNKEYAFKLAQTKGPFQGVNNIPNYNIQNFQRFKLPGKISLDAGVQQITISTSGIENEDVLFDLRSAELLPVSKKAEIINEEIRAKNARASFDWMNKSGYGLMFHWTSRSVQQDGSSKSFEDAVNEFDVEKFANMVEETGAGYVYFTIGHAERYCPAPIKSWERIHPGQTTKRDLIEEIANALNKKGIRFLCYINAPGTFKFSTHDDNNEETKQAFVANFTDILTEMGNRYQDKIAGYWFDSWYQIFQGYQEVPFEAFYKASKIGNKDRIICLNPWIYPDVSPWQDYWSGEIQNPIAPPKNGYMENGPSPNLPYQALLTMEPFVWVQNKPEIADPKFTSEQLSTYIKKCKVNGGAVTINLAIYQDGTVGKKALQVMKEVNKNIKN
ncbi:alpha-L-fucosidase [Formosa sp. PL04]|uniref:alpha-L-fucosidase n=1 Tax=Formosa sp. PL04 TaxID=3081755 RepID=UPI00298142B2|nr:alpha-L-fucosidase [Formosa sp. PL04]MDW5290139.1 alpha-L-fucosidase [Formosa sp. PL04]